MAHKVYLKLRMRSILLGLLVLCVVSFGGWFGSLKEGVEKAKEQKKPLVIYFYSKYCSYCRHFEEFTLSKDEVQNTLEKFVVVSLDISSEEGSQWARKLGVPGVPTMVVYDPVKDQRLGVLFGSRSGDDVVGFIKGICKKQSLKTC